MSEQAIDVQDVSKRFRLYHERATSLKDRALNFGRKAPHDDLWALKDVSFSIKEGETLGILGHNGSGKSTLLKCICGVLRPTSGQVVVRGKLAGLLELGAGFQPELSGRDNIYLNASMLGLSKREVDRVFDDIVNFSELEQFIDNQVKFYSSGMYVRLGFAVAVNVDPDILVIDEVLAVGDERFQRKCLDRIRTFKDEGRTIVVVTHSADQVKSICDRAVVLSHGEVIAEGEPSQAVQALRESLLSEGMLRDHPNLAEEERIIRIRGVHVRHPDAVGERRNEKIPMISGGPVEIVVGFEAEETVEDIAVAVELHTPAGALLMRLSTEDLNLRIDAEKGIGGMVLQFPSFPVSDGAMKLSVGIMQRRSGEMFDWTENAGHIQMTPTRKSAGLIEVQANVPHLSGGSMSTLER